MSDVAHNITNKQLKELEKRIAAEYRTAVTDMEAKLKAYLEKTEKQRLVQEELFKAGKITKKEYQDWCFRHTMMGKRWQEMKDVLAADMHHTNEIALGITKGAMPDVYAINANYGIYQIEHDARIDTGFTLYNHDTAEYLLGDQRQLMPKPSTRKAKQIAANKDMQWNKRKIQSAVLQGVLQGEGPYQIAERLRRVGQMNYNASVRYARTMTTSAQNAGRYESYRRADKLGIDLTIEWQATLDDRTRDHHRAMHGERTTVDEPFYTPDGYTIYYPADCTGDSDAPQHEIWNCRCTLLAWVKGFEHDKVTSSPKLGDMSFDEWQNAHAAGKSQHNANAGGDGENTVSGKQYKPFDTSTVETTNPNHASKETLDNYAAMAGASALDKDEIKYISVYERQNYSTVRIVGKDPGTKVNINLLHDKKTVEIDLIELATQGTGKGTDIFVDIVDAARANGYEKITLDAAGELGSSLNGYYTWPRLGFDAELSPSQVAKAKEFGFNVTKVSELMSTEKGRTYWKSRGDVLLEAEFDLSDGSYSMKTLKKYLMERRKRL